MNVVCDIKVYNHNEWVEIAIVMICKQLCSLRLQLKCTLICKSATGVFNHCAAALTALRWLDTIRLAYIPPSDINLQANLENPAAVFKVYAI